MAFVVHDIDKSPSLAKVLIAAAYTGTAVEVKPLAPGANRSKEFLADFPLGRLPSARTTTGGKITGANTILRYLAQSTGGALYGGDAGERADVDQWLEWSILDIDLPAAAWLYPIKGIIQNNPAATTKAKGDVRKAIETLNVHLASRTFLVGQRVTIADIAVAVSLLELYTTVLDPGFRKTFSHTNRWFNTLVHQPNFAAVLGEVKLAEKMAAAAAPPKEEPKKKEAKPKAEKKKEEAPKKEVEPEEEYKDPPKGKNPLDSLPPSKFNLEDWKREYSNNDTRSVAVPWFWQNYDPEGFSVWFCEYKDAQLLEKNYMVANTLGGWLQRCDPLRKYAFGAFVITGGEGPPANFTIEGVWVFRGKEIPAEMLETPDYDSYSFRRANLETEKQAVEDYFAWGEPTGSIGDRKVNQGKNFK
jgi:elongation factor 1-gamma